MEHQGEHTLLPLTLCLILVLVWCLGHEHHGVGTDGPRPDDALIGIEESSQRPTGPLSENASNLTTVLACPYRRRTRGARAITSVGRNHVRSA